MSDPDGANDTERNAQLPASTDLGADADPCAAEVSNTVPTSPLESEARSNEVNTEDFLGWLPTLWLWQRRRKELMQRRSSDGADFVAYASTGRPVRPGAPVPTEASVQVQTTLSPEVAVERDAPTVFLPRRRGASRQRVAVGFAVVFLVATIGFAAWTHRPPRADDSALAPSTAASPAQGAGDLAAPTELMARSAVPVRATTEVPAAHFTETRKDPRGATGSPLVKESPRRSDGSHVGSLGHDAASAHRAPPSETPAKDRYFEQP